MPPASQCAPRNRWIHWKSIGPNLRCDTNEELHLGSTAQGNDAAALNRELSSNYTNHLWYSVVYQWLSMYIIIYIHLMIYQTLGSFWGLTVLVNSPYFWSISPIQPQKLCFTVVDSSVCDAQDGPSCQNYGSMALTTPKLPWLITIDHHHFPYFPMKIHHFGLWVDFHVRSFPASLWALTASPIRPTGP